MEWKLGCIIESTLCWMYWLFDWFITSFRWNEWIHQEHRAHLHRLVCYRKSVTLHCHPPSPPVTVYIGCNFCYTKHQGSSFLLETTHRSVRNQFHSFHCSFFIFLWHYLAFLFFPPSLSGVVLVFVTWRSISCRVQTLKGLPLYKSYAILHGRIIVRLTSYWCRSS
jgi:hypothetical protein